MKDRKLQKSTQRRADLENLSLLLGISEQFDPRRQVADQIQQEQLQAAILGNQQTRAMAPFAGREAEARIGSVEDQRGYAGQIHPLALQAMRDQSAMQQQSTKFDQELQPGRVDALKYGNQTAKAQGQVAQRTVGTAIRGAKADVQGRVLQNKGQRMETGARQYQLDNSKKMDPVIMQQQQLQLMQLMRDLVIGQTSGVDSAGNPLPAQFDLQGAARQMGAPPIPMVDPSFSAAQAIDAQIAQGMPPDLGEERQDWYEQQVPQLAAGIAAQPQLPWSVPSQAMAEIYNNPTNYGISVDPAKGMRQIEVPYDNGMSRLQQAIELIKQRQQQRQPR